LISLIRPHKPKLADRLANKGKVIAPSPVNPSQIKTSPNIGNLRVQGDVINLLALVKKIFKKKYDLEPKCLVLQTI